MIRAYLDHNATSPLQPAVRDAMLSAFDVVGNPSSVHKEGRAARALIEAARSKVSDLVGAEAGHVIFTSGASEANMLALGHGMKQEFQPAPASHLFYSAIEHPSVLSGGRFGPSERSEIPVDSSGVVDFSALRVLLTTHDRQTGRAMIAVMAVNSETGVIQPYAEIAALASEHDAYFHLDAVQAAGRIPLDITEIGCTSLSLSAHKLGGPMGVGALVMAKEGLEPEPLITGGPQEHRLRAGTENVAGIVGFGEACALAKDTLSSDDGIKRLMSLRDSFEARLLEMAPDVEIFGGKAPRVGNTCQFAVPGLKGETVLIQLDLAGVAVSSGSACSSGKVAASHVLSAMGYGADLATGAIRMSLGWSSQQADIDQLTTALGKICTKYSRKAS
ncbi:cysteine desulfurase family protein [uncultured Cohaesibacter sp.]|uniref:cysteine desulfurase family protein n=1 Tax=uncultured Cohaesibacter sp. TaxID=1002546 RepID=UPI0029C93217|nr:cysteine desulfurase family protein [uncultured Cohaesibacter sp.]